MKCLCPLWRSHAESSLKRWRQTEDCLIEDKIKIMLMALPLLCKSFEVWFRRWDHHVVFGYPARDSHTIHNVTKHGLSAGQSNMYIISHEMSNTKHTYTATGTTHCFKYCISPCSGRFNFTGTISVCHGASSLAPFVFFPKDDSRVRDILASWEGCKYFFKCIFEDLGHRVSSIHQTLVSLKTCAECDVLIAFWHQLKLVVTRQEV